MSGSKETRFGDAADLGIGVRIRPCRLACVTDGVVTTHRAHGAGTAGSGIETHDSISLG